MENKYLKTTIYSILRIYSLALSVFFIFRLILFFTEISRLDFTAETIKHTFYAFVMGIRFDLVIIGYFMMLPALIMLILLVSNKKSKFLSSFLFYFLLTLFFIGFMISAADIPYFNQFFKRFEIGAFEWMDSPLFVFKMLVEEPRYVLAIIPFFLLYFVFYKGLKKIFITYNSITLPERNTKVILKSIWSVIILVVIFIGIRGRVQRKSPIRIGTAYFCQDPFLNQLGLNPVFTFLRSYLDSLDVKNKSIILLDNQVAITNVKKYFGITEDLGFSPIARKVKPDAIATNKPNVVIIIMESMSTAKMKRFGNTNKLTPFLDSLSYKSCFFDHIYTAGEHTYNGIFSTLFSYPALYRQHTMKKIRRYKGIANTLKEKGYSTAYFTTHDGQFDGVEGFLHANDFDYIFSQSSYPSSEVKTTLGVPDDFMFRFSIPKINELARKKKPFLVSFMTTSDHGPYFIPDYFTPQNSDVKKQIVEYADWSLQKFINLASKTSWFDNTIFVFVADHGAPMHVQYPISLNYHHTPLLFYAPKIIEPKLISEIGGQIDIYATLMGFLKQPYVNNTFSIDLLNEKRPYIMINADDKVAVLNREFLFVLKANEKMLYQYSKNDQSNAIGKYPEKAKEMELYLKSNLQTYQYMLANEKTLFNE